MSFHPEAGRPTPTWPEGSGNTWRQSHCAPLPAPSGSGGPVDALGAGPLPQRPQEVGAASSRPNAAAPPPPRPRDSRRRPPPSPPPSCWCHVSPGARRASAGWGGGGEAPGAFPPTGGFPPGPRAGPRSPSSGAGVSGQAHGGLASPALVKPLPPPRRRRPAAAPRPTDRRSSATRGRPDPAARPPTHAMA